MKKIALFTAAIVSFVVGYGIVAEAYPSGGLWGRGEYRGYFTNTQDFYGTHVWATNSTTSGCRASGGNAIPNSINSASEFINFVKCKLNSNNGNSTVRNQERTGAAFIIQTMISPESSPARNRPPTATQIAEWEQRVNYAVSQGWVSWNYNFSFSFNSYFQGTGSGSNPNDDAFYDDRTTAGSIIFRNSAGTIIYGIKHQCANPVGTGNFSPLVDPPSFNMTGRTTITNNTNAGRGVNPLPGDTLVFRHYVRNNGPGSTSPTNIWWVAERTQPTPLTTVGGSANSGVYSSGQEKNVFNHTYTIPASTPPGTRICERVGYDPVNGTGGRNGRGAEVCATVQYNFDLTPSIEAVITSGGSPIPGNIAEPGDTIEFTYAVNNSGTTISQNITCTYHQATNPGHNESAPINAFTPPGANCPPARTFPANSNTDTAVETITANDVNTTICRSLTISPVTQSGGTRTDQICVLVAAKPYTRVWGGDISAGNGLANASGVCTSNNDAAVVSWNKRAVGNYGGAGAQFAVYALERINDFSSALFDPGGAPHPNGLSFANTFSAPATGDFGGGLGSVPCIPDYYATRPGTTQSLPPNISSMTPGIYGATGNITFSGGANIAQGERITVYVDGNVRIDNNINYQGMWDPDNVPLFELIVRGNIYIDNDVTNLDGVFVAQADEDGNGGEIHTCAVDFAAINENELYNNCTQKLTVNGLFVADQIRLLRTNGSLSLSNLNEPSSSGNVAETFNFSPALWLAQPNRDAGNNTPDYDAITSLPPIL